ncbi:MAG: porin family protein [Xanthobacteraceae bacterium]|jgi:opacity protein-like surface antigen/outer membrane protease
MNAHNKHLLRATFIVSALMPVALATAADLPLPPAAPAWTWSGFYIGGSVGTAAGTATFSDPYGPSIFGDKVTTAGFLAGLQLGYNWQVAPRWVVGVVADTSYLDSNGSFTCMQAFTTLIGSNCEVNPRALATVAGRVGFLVDPLGHTLVYGKGGAAWTDSHISIYPNSANFQSFTDPVYPGGPASADAGAWGGMVGVGIERALTPAWSISLEYNYYRFASTNVSTPETVNVTRSTPPAFTYVAGSTSGVTSDMQVVKLALNYHLGQDPGAVWADAPVLGVAAMPVKARSVPIVDGWEVDAGARYWYSTGTSKNTSGAGSLVSQLNYSDLTGHSGELFARVDTPSQVFVKGYVGAGAITDGKQTDEDWSLLDGSSPPKAVTAYEVTGSTASGSLQYAAADVGFNVLHDRDYKVGPFVGYSYFHQTMNASGCTQLVTPGSECSQPLPANQLVVTQDDTWQALRVGVSAVMTIWDRLGINGDVAYLPYAQFSGLDTHWLRTPVAYFPEDGTGRGLQTELILTYRITENLNLGVGGRYWAMWSTSASQSCHGGCIDAAGGDAPSSPPGPFTTNTQRYGTFIQMSYRFNAHP